MNEALGLTRTVQEFRIVALIGNQFWQSLYHCKQKSRRSEGRKIGPYRCCGIARTQHRGRRRLSRCRSGDCDCGSGQRRRCPHNHRRCAGNAWLRCRHARRSAHHAGRRRSNHAWRWTGKTRSPSNHAGRCSNDSRSRPRHPWSGSTERRGNSTWDWRSNSTRRNRRFLAKTFQRPQYQHHDENQNTNPPKNLVSHKTSSEKITEKRNFSTTARATVKKPSATLRYLRFLL